LNPLINQESKDRLIIQFPDCCVLKPFYNNSNHRSLYFNSFQTKQKDDPYHKLAG